MRVAIQGERGSFSHQAAQKMAPGCTLLPTATSREVFVRVEKRVAGAAVLPIENSLAGSVAEHLDLLLEHDLFARAEFLLRIAHNLIAARGTRLGDLRRVYSHPVALEQCRGFLRRHPRISPVPFYDTAGAVKHVMENDRGAAAIAGARAAHEYGGVILRRGIEDDRRNFTRFVLVSRDRRVPRGANKTSIAFALKNVPGALFQALAAFAARGINLSRIESRPVRGRPWEYVFHVDLLRGKDAAARAALRQLAHTARWVKVLGIYRAA